MRVIAIVGVRTYLWHEGGQLDCYDNFSPGNDGKELTPESRQFETIYLCRPGLRPKVLGFDDLWEMDPEKMMRPACLAFDKKGQDWLVPEAIGRLRARRTL